MSWLTASEALNLLGVRRQTLYANVSRRRIRARPDPKDPRRSLYHEADVQKMARSRPGPRKAERIAAGAMEWGDPILPSAICAVAHGRLWYRGHDAVRLADTRALEDAAAILWDCQEVSFPGDLRQAVERGPVPAGRGSAAAGPALATMFAVLAGRAGLDPPSHGRSPAVLRRESAEVLATLASAVVRPGPDVPLHARLATAWRRRQAADTLRRTLVLLADHELNASTFAVRVTISTGASLASGVLAGLATLSGPLHGRAALGVLELARAAGERDARVVVREWLTGGRPLSGFGHPLYPQGDVRAQALLEAFDVPPEYQALRRAVEEIAGERPSVDFALAAMTACFGLPPDAPLVLFAIARSAGWLAHAMEQASAGHLIRPRARYVGPPLGI